LREAAEATVAFTFGQAAISPTMSFGKDASVFERSTIPPSTTSPTRVEFDSVNVTSFIGLLLYSLSTCHPGS
jgi:hypothetical protein